MDVYPADAPLEYECDQCGACCKAFPVFASAQDAEREPRIAQETIRLTEAQSNGERQYQLFPLPFYSTCCFLDRTDQCEIYGTRPAVCREFEPGSDQCQRARELAELPPLPIKEA